MALTVWKYPIALNDHDHADIPAGAEFLAIQNQDGNATMWWLVDPDQPLERHYFKIVGTGHPAPAGATYRGTVQHLDGSLVLHYFEVYA